MCSAEATMDPVIADRPMQQNARSIQNKGNSPSEEFNSRCAMQEQRITHRLTAFAASLLLPSGVKRCPGYADSLRSYR